MRGPYAELLLLFGLLLWTATTISFALNLRDSEVTCIEEEREALLKFKQGLQDDFGRLSSWGSHEEDCCKWKGIECSNRTGRVVKLDLRGNHYSFANAQYVSGEISSSLLGLQHLTYLDLSDNYFSNILPKFIGSLTKLQYLNLSWNSLSGTIPPQLGNLSNLISLNLSWNDWQIEDHNLDWLFHLSSLKHLDMSGADLGKVVNWPDMVNMLPSLLDLVLFDCQLSTPIPLVLSNANYSSPLSFLDLSLNDFSIFPKFISSLTKLQYLYLHHNRLFGSIPPQLGNLSSLISLDLSWTLLIEDHNLDWLIHLPSLRHLSMSGVNLSMVVNWPDKVNMLSSLLDLRLSFSKLSMPIPHVLSNANSSALLSFLHLAGNHINSSIFPWLFKYTNSLVDLDLSDNKLEGSIPKAFGNMVTLVRLDLSSNNLEGAISDLTKLSLLRELRLSKNHLNGSLDNVLGKLSKLHVLDVSFNSFEGIITETHLSNFSTLYHLDFSSNSLSLKFSPDWVPPFRLDIIGLGSCKLGPSFPQWLQTQKNFSWLNMYDVGITDTIPNWFWDISSKIKRLNISGNHINGTIPLQWFLTRFIGPHVIDLSYNRFSGPLPQINSDAFVLNLSNNLFQGTIKFICETNGSSLSYLDLSNNLLSGELPKCWANLMTLRFLNLANNNLFGRIPESFGRICWENNSLSLHFENNSFIGELPVSLMNCSSLKVLDFGENRLSGRIPTWIGTSLRHLVVLRLPSNVFVGSIPLQLCQLTFLQILDLSQNNISGTTPRCLNNFTAMVQKQNLETSTLDDHSFFPGSNYLTIFELYYFEHASVNTKGMHLEYNKILRLVKVLDLSSNKLMGEIPKQITSLLGLIGLNLSRNLLTGIIPQSIGDLERLESLDLSNNHLTDVIPLTLATLSFLSYLNLSNNNLSGRVPIGTQLQGFGASPYAGNQDLCGLPLLTRCLGDEPDQGPQIGSTHGEESIQEHANSHEHLWFYTSIAIGFIVGFWGVCGSLMLKSSWRHAYFQFLDRMGDKLYVTIAINIAKLLRNFKTQCSQENIL